MIPVISVIPDRVFFTGIPDSKLKKNIIIKSYNENKPLEVQVKNTSVTSQITYRLTRIKENCIRLTVKNNVENAGNYRNRLIFTTNFKERPVIVIPVFGRILAGVTIVPTKVDFGRIYIQKLKQESLYGINRKYHKNIFLRLNNGKNFRITSLETDKNFFKTKIKEVLSGRVYRVTLLPATENMQRGKVNATLTIHTNDTTHPVISIPVTADVK